MRPSWSRGDLTVHWVDGGLYVACRGVGLLLDAPPAAADALGGLGALGRVDGVFLTSGRLRAVGGLVPLLAALERHRAGRPPLTVWHHLVEERGPLLASAWERGWPGGLAIRVDGVTPEAELQHGPFLIRTRPVPHAEARWTPEPTLVPRPALAIQVHVVGAAVAWVPGAAPGAAARRACRDMDLAVVEVGVVDRPGDDRPWRMSAAEAVEAATEADEVWLVGDDGSFAGGDETIQ